MSLEGAVDHGREALGIRCGKAEPDLQDPRDSSKLGEVPGCAFEARQVLFGADEHRLEPVREGEQALGIGLPETLVVPKKNALDHLGALGLERRKETLRRGDPGPGNDTPALQPGRVAGHHDG